KMGKTIWVILVLVAAIVYSDSQSFYDEMTCGNCSSVNDECEVTSTGWNCEYKFDTRKLIENGDSSDIPKSLSNCMLPGMEFKIKKALYGHCCVWSPKIGCQKIMKKDDENLCYHCTRAIWLPVMEGLTCPCGNWYLHGESSGIMFIPWKFLFITQGILIIILN
ncbi:hypothetical protein KR200_005126, partial [Drosophila serrata]